MQERYDGAYTIAERVWYLAENNSQVDQDGRRRGSNRKKSASYKLTSYGWADSQEVDDRAFWDAFEHGSLGRRCLGSCNGICACNRTCGGQRCCTCYGPGCSDGGCC